MVQGLEPKKWHHREKFANVPQQSNITDCGMFAVMYAESFVKWHLGGRAGNPRLDFTELEVSQSKKRLSEGFLYESDILTRVLEFRCVQPSKEHGY